MCVFREASMTHHIMYKYNIHGHTLEQVESFRDLGVILDRKLRFHEHIDHIATKGFQMLGFVLRNTKEFKRPSTKILLYQSLVRSGLEYCSQVWSPQYDVHIKRIERIQKRFLWHISYQGHKAKELPSYENRLVHFKINSLQERRLLLDHMLLYKIINGAVDCPSLLKSINIKVPLKLPRASRYSPFLVRGSKTNLGHHAAMNRIQRQYNALNSDSIDIFSNKPQKFKRNIVASFSSKPT
jgi:hypothetical protein